ncbi:ATP-dependent RNA helicase cyt-19, mitochondrial [Podospora australis]|uniref:ATP-dependent RNA helicase n=1 Tax=Podospora australis TaxID=1536484 RepID=A0AAN6X474_9PEZI|nr:ATP-dependent RNA helicase cyt-19, mitochondrial [Podospora australis]
MMRSNILRHAAACRVAIAARPVQIASRVSASALASSRTSSLAVACRPFNSLLRFYSSESAAVSEELAQSDVITKFRDLESVGVHRAIVRSIVNGMKYEDMTTVQSLTIKPALAGKDLVAQAKTGTGKTLAFLVPIIQKVLESQPDLAEFDRRPRNAKSDDIRAVIISPTRELAEQIGAEASKLVQGTGIKVQVGVGGTGKRDMLWKCRREGCHILVGTPGRLNDLLEDTTSGIAAPNLQALCLDEADRMLDVGFDKELDSILRLLPNRRDVPRQTLLYSATMPKDVVGLARKYINPSNFEFVQTVRGDETPTHERVPQYIIPCRGFDNMPATFLELLRREQQAARDDKTKLPVKMMVFLPTTASVIAWAFAFRRLAYQDRTIPKVSDIHSKLTQATRTRAAEDFKRAQSAILFSSDVTARGMDFPNVTHVVQIHLPGQREDYIHRIGRTGRAGKEGKAYLLASDNEIPVARRRLPGLPIQRCADFPSASIDVSNANPDELPPSFKEIRGAFSKTPSDIIQQWYSAYLGGATKGVDKQDVIYEINAMSKNVFGLDEQPGVSPSLLRNLGRVDGLRVATPEPDRYHRDGARGGFGGRDQRGGGRGGFGGRDQRGGGRGGFERKPRDGFEAMEFAGRESKSSRPPPASF